MAPGQAILEELNYKQHDTRILLRLSDIGTVKTLV